MMAILSRINLSIKHWWAEKLKCKVAEITFFDGEKKYFLVDLGEHSNQTLFKHKFEKKKEGHHYFLRSTGYVTWNWETVGKWKVVHKYPPLELNVRAKPREM